MTFYPVTAWPHISVLDPRTGEQLTTWNKIPDSSCFCELVAEFLTLNPSLDQTANGPPAKKKAKKENILDANEDDQLAAAIQASLADSQPSSSTSTSYLDSKNDGGSKKCTLVDSDDSEFEPYSGEESNLSVPTPVKQRSKANSRAVSPGRQKAYKLHLVGI